MSDTLPVIESHLASGESWVLSRGRDEGSGATRLVLTVTDARVGVAAVRDWLAVAGSLGGHHLAEVIDVVGLADGSVAVVFATRGGPSLAEVLRRRGARGALSAGEVVTLVAPLAATLAALGARGVSVGVVSRETVWLSPDGTPLVVPVAVGRSRGDGGDVIALAGLARSLLDLSSGQAGPVSSALAAAVAGVIDGSQLSASLLRAATAAPVSVAAAGPRRAAAPARRRSRRQPAWRGARPVAAIVVVMVVAIGLGGLWGRHDGGGAAVAAPVPAPRAAMLRAATPQATPRSWLAVMTDLERTRASAYATGSVRLLDDVYAAASPTGAADRDLLMRLVAEQQRARGLRAFVQRVDVVSISDANAALVVTDALTSYDVIGPHGHVVRKGRGRPARPWQVRLVRSAGVWRIWSVRPV